VPSAAILAGGDARRYGGRDKSRLCVGGRTMLERQLAALASITNDVMVVGARAEDNPLKEGRYRTVSDRVPASGPLGGLDAALAAARSSDVLLLACDMPFVTTAFLEYLVSQAGDADAVVPATERGYHPLCAVYNRRCHAAVAEALMGRQLRMTELLKRICVREIGVDDIGRFGPPAHLLANVNTPAEFEQIAAPPGHKL
jgi:molybdopterin-guanine dinucleotide biosynthesis protein A